MLMAVIGFVGQGVVGLVGRVAVDPDLARPARWLRRRRLLAQVDVSPDLDALPGGRQLQQLVDGSAAFALVVLVGAIVGGAVLWAVGAAGTNYGQVGAGKRMVLLGMFGAVIVGGAATHGGVRRAPIRSGPRGR